MITPILTKSRNAGAAVRARRFVKFGATGLDAVEATAAADWIIGVSEQVDAPAGDRVDIVMLGITEIVCGAAVTRGQLLTSDAQGRAIPAAPAAGANVRIGAIAMASSGAADDIVPVLVTLGSTQG